MHVRDLQRLRLYPLVLSGKVSLLNRQTLPVVFTLLAALALTDAARAGWGAATIEGDRVKWGLRSIGRSPLQPTIVIKDFCWWSDGPVGLCALEPGSEWAAAFFRAASPLAWIAVGCVLISAGLIALRRRRLAILTLIGSAVFAAALGITAVVASHRISIFIRHAADPGWSGSLTWRAALLMIAAALVSWFWLPRSPSVHPPTSAAARQEQRTG